MQNLVEQARFELAFCHALPSSLGPFGIEKQPLRAQIRQAEDRLRSSFGNSLIRVDESIENGGSLVSDCVAEKVRELTAHELLHVDDQAVGGLHQHPDALLESPCLPAQVVQHGVDVTRDTHDFFERITIEYRDHVVPDVSQRLQAVQQISNIVLGLGNVVGEIVERVGNRPAPSPNLTIAAPMCDKT